MVQPNHIQQNRSVYGLSFVSTGNDHAHKYTQCKRAKSCFVVVAHYTGNSKCSRSGKRKLRNEASRRKGWTHSSNQATKDSKGKNDEASKLSMNEKTDEFYSKSFCSVNIGAQQGREQ